MSDVDFGTDPLLGWRVWLLLETDEGVRLSSVVYRELWPVRAPAQVRCVEGRCLGATWPNVGHSCGIHAFKERAQALDFPAHWEAVRVPLARFPDTYVVGQVSLWGRVSEHEAGYRAQYAYPYSLVVPARLEAMASGLRSAYRVDVEVTTG